VSEPGGLAAAITSETKIAKEAASIREKDKGDALTGALFMQLYPLLCMPIPKAFIQHLPATKGKPYQSTGIRSVQVQINRMNNVLTPLWWWDTKRYDADGQVCEVVVYVGNRRPASDEGASVILAEGSSYGGVSQGSALGNIYKGSYTNAAKLAFAHLGVGNEVYLGATDYDPDVDADLANVEPEKPADPSRIGIDIAKKLVDRAFKIESAKDNYQLAASHAADRDVGPAGSKKAAIKATAGLTFGQAEKLERWIEKKENAAKGEGSGDA
jgi:hypothetical protein